MSDDFAETDSSEDPSKILEALYKIRTVDYRPHWQDDRGFLYNALADLHELGESPSGANSDIRLLQGMRLQDGRMEIFTYHCDTQVLRLFTDHQVIIHTFEAVRVVNHNIHDVVDLRVDYPFSIEAEDYHPYYDASTGRRVWARDGIAEGSSQELVACRRYQAALDLRSFLSHLPLAAPQYKDFRWLALCEALSQWLQGDGPRLRQSAGSSLSGWGIGRYIEFSRAYKQYGQSVNFDAPFEEECRHFMDMLNELKQVLMDLGVFGAADEAEERFRQTMTDSRKEALGQGSPRLADLFEYAAKASTLYYKIAP